MQPQYKFMVVVRMTEEIISSAADGMLPLGPCSDVISDALELLGITEMQIDVKKGLPTAEENLDDVASQVRMECCSEITWSSRRALQQCIANLPATEQ
jgi:hypothetical protein